MRREKIVVIADDNRDKGRQYKLTEMPASQGEWFAFRAFTALAQGGIELPDDFKQMGMASLARLTLQQLGKVKPSDARPLLDELYQQVQFIPDPKSGVSRFLMEEDIDEISTHFKLKWELIKLHAGFFRDRQPIDFGISAGGHVRGLVEYTNVPRTIATVVSSKLATLHELDTVYGTTDMWTFLEITAVDNHNQSVLNGREGY